MRIVLAGLFFLLITAGTRFCQTKAALKTQVTVFPAFDAGMRVVKDIPLPKDYIRIPVPRNSFATYLRSIPLRRNNTVYLYNRQPKSNQSLHYAVLDISTGDKYLQQCADAIMRIRAEYFYQRKLYDSIYFRRDAHTVYHFRTDKTETENTTHEKLLQFMEKVFINCGTYQLEKQLKPVNPFSAMQIGDVLVKGGAPGHAEIVTDMAYHKQTGKKIFLLAEGYMPAQDIHILLNPLHPTLGPWYELDTEQQQVVTASWVFSTNQLKHW